jgi:hypothetical protein
VDSYRAGNNAAGVGDSNVTRSAKNVQDYTLTAIFNDGHQVTRSKIRSWAAAREVMTAWCSAERIDDPATFLVKVVYSHTETLVAPGGARQMTGNTVSHYSANEVREMFAARSIVEELRSERRAVRS